MTYDPFADDPNAPAHDDFAAKVHVSDPSLRELQHSHSFQVLLDPIRSQKAKTSRNEMKAEMEGKEIGWTSKKQQKRAKRQKLEDSTAKDNGV